MKRPLVLLATVTAIALLLASSQVSAARKRRNGNADINRDNHVNTADLSILASNYGKSPRAYAQGDINRDRRVDVTDLSILATDWGN